MDFNKLEDSGRQIVINLSETQDFENCLCGEGSLYLVADQTHLKVFRHTPSRSEDPYQLFAKLNLSITSHK